ncbi:hypothetical protein CRG98_040713 [Punica granatum]|uniref:Uncharacterized protein n=1 Tax=Punica granatum TaxID=22663 RepID=A0A2I0I657_PUNGR|nr:hypothetical protein CRG98_040713 [Punica granatum]
MPRSLVLPLITATSPSITPSSSAVTKPSPLTFFPSLAPWLPLLAPGNIPTAPSPSTSVFSRGKTNSNDPQPSPFSSPLGPEATAVAFRTGTAVHHLSHPSIPSPRSRKCSSSRLHSPRIIIVSPATLSLSHHSLSALLPLILTSPSFVLRRCSRQHCCFGELRSSCNDHHHQLQSLPERRAASLILLPLQLHTLSLSRWNQQQRHPDRSSSSLLCSRRLLPLPHLRERCCSLLYFICRSLFLFRSHVAAVQAIPSRSGAF